MQHRRHILALFPWLFTLGCAENHAKSEADAAVECADGAPVEHCPRVDAGDVNVSPYPKADAGIDAGNAGVDASSGGVDAGGDASLDAGHSPGSECVTGPVSWAYDGGRNTMTETYSLAPCRNFTWRSVNVGDPGSGTSCQNEIAVDAKTSLASVIAGLADADVVSSLATPGKLYGQDPRFYDGAVFRITVGSASVDVGDACGSVQGCTPIPKGLAAARDILQALAEQQRVLGACRSTI